VFTMRFDMRAPSWGGASSARLYAAAIEMAEWGESRGCVSVQVSEHHASPDGYLPAPLLLASAIAARTKSLPLQVAAIILPLHDPISLAEQMVVADILAAGRLSCVLALGYRDEEYAMFGRDPRERGKRMDACVQALQRAFAGEPFEFEGRPVRVTPPPHTPGGPLLLLGGNSKAAVRRAARFGLGMITQGGNPELDELYQAECAKHGTKPGMFVNPPSGSILSGFVAEDPDRAWSELGPYLLHDANMYAQWMGGSAAATKSEARTIDALRAEKGSYQILTPEEARAHIDATGLFMTQPLCGGLPPELAWPSLELLANRVLA